MVCKTHGDDGTGLYHKNSGANYYPVEKLDFIHTHSSFGSNDVFKDRFVIAGNLNHT
jgi:hypothetical protein